MDNNIDNKSIIPIGNALPAIVKKTNTQLSIMKKILDDATYVYSDLPELIPYRKGRKFGFCNRRKKIVIECVYDTVRDFSEGLAYVEKDEKIWLYR